MMQNIGWAYSGPRLVPIGTLLTFSVNCVGFWILPIVPPLTVVRGPHLVNMWIAHRFPDCWTVCFDEAKVTPSSVMKRTNDSIPPGTQSIPGPKTPQCTKVVHIYIILSSLSQSLEASIYTASQTPLLLSPICGDHLTWFPVPSAN